MCYYYIFFITHGTLDLVHPHSHRHSTFWQIRFGNHNRYPKYLATIQNTYLPVTHDSANDHISCIMSFRFMC